MYSVYCDDLLIGTSELEQRGLPRGILRGQFVPAPDYPLVRPLFRALAMGNQESDGDLEVEELLRLSYQTRDKLRLRIERSEGWAVPVEYIALEEPQSSREPIELVARLKI